MCFKILRFFLHKNIFFELLMAFDHFKLMLYFHHMKSEIILPEKLQPHRDLFEQTAKTFNRIVLSKKEQLSPWDSKVGGLPYWLKEMTFPTNEKGEALQFLAQINFEKMPPLENFPTEGLLQFFINDDDLYGVDFDEPTVQKNFQVIYHKDIDQESILEDFSFLPVYAHSPISKMESVLNIDFETQVEIVPTADYEFEQHFGDEFFMQFGPESWDILEVYNEAIRSKGHKVAGYADFTQFDPRVPENPMMLLFQLDSDSTNGISWGDLGVANFFIKKEHLINKDFSEVLYNWDCC